MIRGWITLSIWARGAYCEDSWTIKDRSCTQRKKLIDESSSPMTCTRGKTTSIIDNGLRQNALLEDTKKFYLKWWMGPKSVHLTMKYLMQWLIIAGQDTILSLCHNCPHIPCLCYILVPAAPEVLPGKVTDSDGLGSKMPRRSVRLWENQEITAQELLCFALLFFCPHIFRSQFKRSIANPRKRHNCLTKRWTGWREIGIEFD